MSKRILMLLRSLSKQALLDIIILLLQPATDWIEIPTILQLFRLRVGASGSCRFLLQLISHRVYSFIVQKQGLMFFDEEEQAQAAGQEALNNQIASALKDQEISTSQSTGVDTIKFSCIVGLFTKLSSLRSKKKSDYLRSFLKVLFRNSRKPDFTYSVLRLLLPAEDRERGNYGVKEKNLAIIAKECFNLPRQQYERLKHFKNPNYHQGGVGIGDFAICLYDVIKGVCNQKSELTVKRLNDLLDQMASKQSTAQKTQVFRQLYKQANAQQIKWIARIILKDLKLSIKSEYVLNNFHPDGNDAYNLTNSILKTCQKLESLQTSLNDEIAIFHPIRPMLAGKRSMKFFQSNPPDHPYFVETKFDGERLQVHLDKGEVKMFSRNGMDYKNVYDNMMGQIFKANITCDSCILDGEIIVLEKATLNPMPFGMNKIVALGGDADMQLCYKVFDILWVKKEEEDINLMSYPLRERKKILEKVINEVTGKIQVVKYKVMSDFQEIEKQFKDSMERNEEGLMLKDPDSPYVPKERAMNWLKMKGDYVEGMTDTLDLIILGGYFGNLSYRIGPGGHWTDKVTTFLLGVIEKIDAENPKIAYAIPFCKVGTGYSGQQLEQLRAQLRKNLILNQNNKRPNYLVGNWKPKHEDKPDCYINFLYNSKILEVKGAQLISSEAFGTPVTLRFPRVTSIRYDKDWNEAMTLEELNNIQNSEKYSKNMRKKRAGSDSQEEKPQDQGATKKKTKLEKVKKNNEILEQFKCVSLNDEKMQSHLFSEMEFFVFQLESNEVSKHDVERAILLNSGKVVQNPMITTEFVVADRIDFKLRLLEKNQQKSFTFIKPQYIFNCIKAEMIIPLSPIYLTVLPLDKRDYYRENFDKFGDSYTTFLNRRQLDELLRSMDDDRIYERDPRLEQKLCLQRRREGKVSLALGLTIMETVRLKMAGNRLVGGFTEQLNSIVVGRDVSDVLINKINNYALGHPQVQVETLEELYESMVLV